MPNLRSRTRGSDDERTHRSWLAKASWLAAALVTVVAVLLLYIVVFAVLMTR